MPLPRFFVYGMMNKVYRLQIKLDNEEPSQFYYQGFSDVDWPKHVPRVIRSSMFHYNQMTSFTSHEYASIEKWVGELIGGSQREERLDYLDNRLDELKLSKESLWWYRDLRNYGTEIYDAKPHHSKSISKTKQKFGGSWGESVRNMDGQKVAGKYEGHQTLPPKVVFVVVDDLGIICIPSKEVKFGSTNSQATEFVGAGTTSFRDANAVHVIMYHEGQVLFMKDIEFGKLQAMNMLEHLWTQPISNASVEFVQGGRSVEVRANRVTKGVGVSGLLGQVIHEKDMTSPIDYVLRVGHFLLKLHAQILHRLTFNIDKYVWL
ncbi:alpha,alpha-trehalose-phosphate synthase [UDP-forming] 1-like protein [Tanacetum coccineum]